MDKMLLVTEIKSCWVPSDRHAIRYQHKREYQNLVAHLNAPDYSQVEAVTEEMVYGRRFMRKTVINPALPPTAPGNVETYEICLGLSNEASEAIGIAIGAFEEQEKTLENLRFNLKASQRSEELLRIKLQSSEAIFDSLLNSFWNRVKFLFKRY